MAFSKASEVCLLWMKIQGATQGEAQPDQVVSNRITAHPFKWTLCLWTNSYLTLTITAIEDSPDSPSNSKEDDRPESKSTTWSIKSQWKRMMMILRFLSKQQWSPILIKSSSASENRTASMIKRCWSPLTPRTIDCKSLRLISKSLAESPPTLEERAAASSSSRRIKSTWWRQWVQKNLNLFWTLEQRWSIISTNSKRRASKPAFLKSTESFNLS